MDVLCTIVDGSLSIGGTMTLVVDQVIEATSATAIGPDQIVLSANALSNTYYTDALRNIPVGATVTVTVSAAMGTARETLNTPVLNLSVLTDTNSTPSAKGCETSPCLSSFLGILEYYTSFFSV